MGAAARLAAVALPVAEGWASVPREEGSQIGPRRKHNKMSQR